MRRPRSRCAEYARRRLVKPFLTVQYSSMRPDVFHLMAVLKQIHAEVQALRKDIDELRDEVKVMDQGGGIQFMLNGGDEGESEDDDDDSVQSAPATVSYEM